MADWICFGNDIIPICAVEIHRLADTRHIYSGAICVSHKRFKNLGAPISYYFIVAAVWLILAPVLDYVIIVKGFNSQNYYDFEVMIYYAVTFLIPLAIGYKYGQKGTIQSNS
ncbi:MAG: hypothetical protein ACOYT7_03415 [Patescibacteria group bacterium]